MVSVAFWQTLCCHSLMLGPVMAVSMLTERPGMFTPLERINQLFREHYLISVRPSTQNDLLIALPTTYYLAC